MKYKLKVPVRIGLVAEGSGKNREQGRGGLPPDALFVIAIRLMVFHFEGMIVG